MFLYYFIQLIAHGQVHMNEHCKYDRISLRARSHLRILSLTGKTTSVRTIRHQIIIQSTSTLRYTS